MENYSTGKLGGDKVNFIIDVFVGISISVFLYQLFMYLAKKLERYFYKRLRDKEKSCWASMIVIFTLISVLIGFYISFKFV